MKTSFLDWLPSWRFVHRCDTEVFPRSGYMTFPDSPARLKVYLPPAACREYNLTNTDSYCAQHRALSANNNVIDQDRPLAMRFYTLEVLNAHSLYGCRGYLVDNFAIPLTEYAPFRTYHMFNWNTTNITHWDVAIFDFIPGKTTNRIYAQWSDPVPLYESYVVEMLSVGQPSGEYQSGGTTLWSVLFIFFDWQTVVLSNVLTMICVLMCFVALRLIWIKKRKKTSLARWCCGCLTTFVALFSDQIHEFQVECIDPLRRRLRGRLRHVILFYLSAAIIMWSGLFGEIFSGELLSQMVTKPLLYLDTTTDFLKYRKQYNLSFVSFGVTLNVSFGRKILHESDDPSLTEIAQHYESPDSIWYTAEVVRLMSQNNYVINTGGVGCEVIKLRDPLWHSKPYHCMSQKVTSYQTSVMINRSFRHGSKKRKRVLQLARHIVESNLMRRLSGTDQSLHHSRGMAANQFESHADTTITPVQWKSVGNILLNVCYLYAVFVILRLMVALIAVLR